MNNTQRQIGLYFGSFNPPHIGHMAIANYIIEFSDIDELWFVVSPQNPLKDESILIQARTRLELVRRSIGDFGKMRVSDIEFDLPTPNYTINTLIALEEKYPQYKFCLIMGMDNLETLNKWKAWETIVEEYKIIVYPRLESIGGNFISHKNITIIDAPIMKVSSSFIRKSISENKNIRFFLREAVYDMIEKENLYK